MAAVLMQASATVWPDVPTSLPTWASLQRPLTYNNVGEKKWQTFVKCSFHKAAIVEQSQDQNDNVDADYCLSTSLLQLHPLRRCTVFVHQETKQQHLFF